VSDFSIYNLPFGVFDAGRGPRVGVAFGDSVVDLAEAASLGYFRNVRFPDLSVFSRSTLNAFIALGKPYWQAVRNRVAELILDPRLLVDLKTARMLFPIEIGDFVDFYSSREHATNVGKMFRDPDHPLMPNWKHLPVGYNGRTSSIIMSGQDIRRPKGQINPENRNPELGPTRQLDFELEVGFIVGRNTKLGSSVSVDQAEDCIFGLVLLNDWSARDIQRWEYVPLGPFLGKSFATSISPWVVTLTPWTLFAWPGRSRIPRRCPTCARMARGTSRSTWRYGSSPHRKPRPCASAPPVSAGCTGTCASNWRTSRLMGPTFA